MPNLFSRAITILHKSINSVVHANTKSGEQDSGLRPHGAQAKRENSVDKGFQRMGNQKVIKKRKAQALPGFTSFLIYTYN